LLNVSTLDRFYSHEEPEDIIEVTSSVGHHILILHEVDWVLLLLNDGHPELINFIPDRDGRLEGSLELLLELMRNGILQVLVLGGSASELDKRLVLLDRVSNQESSHVGLVWLGDWQPHRIRVLQQQARVIHHIFSLKSNDNH